MSGRNTETTSPAARAARARELIQSAPSAADLLGFYAALAEYQQRLAAECEGNAAGAADGSLLDAVDAAWVGRAARDFTAYVVSGFSRTGIVPSRLRESAEALHGVDAEAWSELFESYRASPAEADDRFSEAAVFTLEAVLQPTAERLASACISLACGANPSGSRSANPRCPACGELPAVGVLREAGHGARRRLVCGLCLTEWDYLRLVCVGCGEQRFDALPVFSAGQCPYARIDACDTCWSYVKTIDATKDGRAIPVVDDLATVTLDLWARDQGYARVRSNLVRI